MLERLRRFSALEKPAQGLFVRAVVLLPVVSLSLRWRGFRATQELLERFAARRKPKPPLNPEPVAALATRMVKAASRHGLVHPSCLEESVTLWWLLSRCGVSSEIRIGIRNVGTFSAHAWVEREGRPLNEPDGTDRHYAAFEKAFLAQAEP